MKLMTGWKGRTARRLDAGIHEGLLRSVKRDRLQVLLGEGFDDPDARDHVGQQGGHARAPAPEGVEQAVRCA